MRFVKKLLLHQTGDVSEIIRINKPRWEIEENFRVMKTEFEARLVYVRREDRIKAHFITDGDAVRIFPEIINNGLGTIKCFLTVGNPLFVIADVKQSIEFIAISIFFTCSIKMKLVLFP